MQKSTDNFINFLSSLEKENDVYIKDAKDFFFISASTNFAFPKFVIYNNISEEIIDYTIEIIKKNSFTAIPFQISEHLLTKQTLLYLKQYGFLPLTFWTNMKLSFKNFLFTNNIHSDEIKIIQLNIDDINYIEHLKNWIKIVENELFNHQNLNIQHFINLLLHSKVNLFLLYYQNIPITTTLVFKDKFAGLYMVATDKRYKGKGFGKILLNEVFYFLKKVGFEEVYLQSTKEGLPFYQKIGFEKNSRQYILNNIL